MICFAAPVTPSFRKRQLATVKSDHATCRGAPSSREALNLVYEMAPIRTNRGHLKPHCVIVRLPLLINIPCNLNLCNLPLQRPCSRIQAKQYPQAPSPAHQPHQSQTNSHGSPCQKSVLSSLRWAFLTRQHESVLLTVHSPAASPSTKHPPPQADHPRNPASPVHPATDSP